MGRQALVAISLDLLEPLDESARLKLGLFLGCMLANVVAWLRGSTPFADMGLVKPSHEASLYQLGAACFVSVCICTAVVFTTGQQDSAAKWLSLIQKVLAPLVACSAFMVVGPALMLLNKHIMEDHDFPYPLSLSSLGLVASGILARALVGTGMVQLRPETLEAVAGDNYWRVIFPIGGARAITLATGNAVYLFLSLGFIQMLKAFTPAIVLVVMSLAQVKPPAKAASWCVMVIVAGTLVEVNGELHFSALGLALMMTSSFGEAIATVLSQRLLQNLNFTTVETMYYLSIPSLIILAVPSSILEWRSMVESGRHALFVERPLLLLTAAALGVAVNFLTLMVIQATSSVTVKILNTVRCIALVAVGVAFYGESHSTRQMVGYAVSLIGFVGYNYFQMRPDRAAELEVWVEGRSQRWLGTCNRKTATFLLDSRGGVEASVAQAR